MPAAVEQALQSRNLGSRWSLLHAQPNAKRQAKRLALMAHRIDVQEALAIGLVQQVAARSDLDAAVDKALNEIRQNSPGSLREIKSLFA